MSNADVFLQQKVLETLGEYGVPGLAAAVVASHGAQTASAQKGTRKVGGGGTNNAILPVDRFNLGSVSKVITGYLMARLIQDSVGGLKWETTLGEVFPELASLPAGRQPTEFPRFSNYLRTRRDFPTRPRPMISTTIRPGRPPT